MRRLLVLPMLIAVSMGVELPQDGPVPQENPRLLAAQDPTPVPEQRPDGTSGTDDMPATPGTTISATPGPKPADKKAPSDLPSISRPKPDEAALALCEAELRKLGTVFDRQDPVRDDNGCGIDVPYAVSEIVKGVQLSPASQVRCETALALARWTDTVLVPAAEALPDKVALLRINHGSTYICRRRNNLPTGKMSEHAIGNAIDITDFEFEGRQPIGISPRQGDGDIEEAFQRAARGGACLHFTTVLGPGSDASHAGHLHLDIAKRRGGYRLCQ